MHALSFQDIDPAHHSIRCYEVFRDDRIAFEHKGQFCFGPRAKLSAFLSGSSESFLFGEEAEAKIAELRKQQGESRFHSISIPHSTTDELAATRKRWESERASGQWGSSRTSAKS